MPKYEVCGEYGPHAGQALSLDIEADDETQAEKQFRECVQLNYPEVWKRMGSHSVRVTPYDDTQPQTMWIVSLKNRFSETVRAHTFLGAVQEAKQLCKKRGIPESDIIGVEYLAY